MKLPPKKNTPVDKTIITAQSVAGQREAAAERRARYPYHFPVDRRQLGGKFTVKENGRRLLRYFYLERRLMHALGAWALTIPEYEVKLETGRHIFYHADAARALRERLSEQEMRPPMVDAHRDPEIDRFIDELLSAESAAELLVGVHQVVGRAIATTYNHHIDDTDQVTDVPTIRCLRRILTDYEPMLAWADAAVDAYIAGGVEEAKLSTWRWHISRLLASIGGVTGADARGEAPTPLRIVIDHAMTDRSDAPRFDKNSYEAIRLRFIRTQRDEVDAIEAFGTFVWDIRFKDFNAEYDLARITWDEARHTEIGHRAMLASGYDPYELRNRLTGSTCRGPMDPAFAMAEINLFGEVGVLKTINDLIDTAADRNDELLRHISDYIRADERTHVRKGTKILEVMTKLESKALELRTRELFTECLVSLGAIKKDIDMQTLTREEIEHLVGE